MTLRPFALVMLALAASVPARAELDRALLLQAAASVLKIEVIRQQGGYSLGSGVVVADDLVVTNCHVTQTAVNIHVLRGERRWRVQTQARDAAHDLCLLRVPGLVATGVVLGRSADLKPGQAVAAVGYTGGMGLQSSTGSVVALHRLDGGHVVQTDNWFSSGASGGALFDEGMRLVGVLTFRLRGGELHYFAAPVEWLRPLLLDEAGFRPVAPGAANETAYWQRPPAQQPHFLQAAALQRDQRWPELQALAQRWRQSDAQDPAALNTLALALERTDQLREAQGALEQSLALDPASGPTWLHLGQIALRRGELAHARSIRARLDILAPALATALAVPAP